MFKRILCATERIESARPTPSDGLRPREVTGALLTLA